MGTIQDLPHGFLPRDSLHLPRIDFFYATAEFFRPTPDRQHSGNDGLGYPLSDCYLLAFIFRQAQYVCKHLAAASLMIFTSRELILATVPVWINTDSSGFSHVPG